MKGDSSHVVKGNAQNVDHSLPQGAELVAVMSAALRKHP
jgi:hypothetical protein